MLEHRATSGICSALLNGVTCSASRACISVVLLVRLAITIEMPIELPMLRTSVRIGGAARCADAPGSVANATVLSGTNTQAEADALHDAGDDDGAAARCRAVKPVIW